MIEQPLVGEQPVGGQGEGGGARAALRDASVQGTTGPSAAVDTAEGARTARGPPGRVGIGDQGADGLAADARRRRAERQPCGQAQVRIVAPHQRGECAAGANRLREPASSTATGSAGGRATISCTRRAPPAGRLSGGHRLLVA